jgi:hypothetical protein
MTTSQINAHIAAEAAELDACIEAARGYEAMMRRESLLDAAATAVTAAKHAEAAAKVACRIAYATGNAEQMDIARKAVYSASAALRAAEAAARNY